LDLRSVLFLYSDGQLTLTQLMGCPSKPKEPQPEKAAPAPVEEAHSLDGCDEGSRGSGTMETGDQISECADFNTEYAPEPEYVENHSHIVWKQGDERAARKASNNGASASLWGVLSTIREENDEEVDVSSPSSSMNQTRSFSSSWDAMFAEKTEEAEQSQVEEEGLDHLFGLFEESPVKLGASQTKSQGVPFPDVNISMSMLSQEAQDITSTFCAEITTDKAKTSSLERSCPNWKENIAFTFFQKEKGDLTDALENVKHSRRRMLEKKRKFLEAWDRQEMVLEVFESALSTSLDRIQTRRGKMSEPGLDVFNGGFLTAMSQENDEMTESKIGGQGNGPDQEASAPHHSVGQCRVEQYNDVMDDGVKTFDRGVSS
jgi:hypothetical protein